MEKFLPKGEILAHYRNPNLSNSQKQILNGTLLGGSSLISPKFGKNCYLSMRDRNFNWLSYKVLELSVLFKKDSIIRQEGNTHRIYSLSYPIFSEIYHLFYKKNKNRYINSEILESLNDLAWMIWFVDSGFVKKDQAYLRLTYYSPKDIITVRDYFCSLNCKCDFKDKTLVFTEEGSVIFLKTFAHRVPDFIKW